MSTHKTCALEAILKNTTGTKPTASFTPVSSAVACGMWCARRMCNRLTVLGVAEGALSSALSEVAVARALSASQAGIGTQAQDLELQTFANSFTTPQTTPRCAQTWCWELLQRQPAVSRCHVVLAVSPPACCQPSCCPPSLFAPLRSYDIEMLDAVVYAREIAIFKLP